MTKKNSSRFGKAAFSSKAGYTERKESNRTEKKVQGEKPLLHFNFKDFNQIQCPPGQKFADWEKEGLLSDFFQKLVDLSQKDRLTASREKCITVYHSFPPNSDFKIPKYIEGDVDWAVIDNVGGQKHRVAGYIVENVFYIVFLDKDHKFWKMQNK